MVPGNRDHTSTELTSGISPIGIKCHVSYEYAEAYFSFLKDTQDHTFVSFEKYHGHRDWKLSKS
jgi:hypothetical protein